MHCFSSMASTLHSVFYSSCLRTRNSLTFLTGGLNAWTCYRFVTHMTVVLIKVAFFFSLISQADTIPVQEKVYTVSEVSIKPTPAKGLTNFHDRWSKSVEYPERALKEKVQGMVFIQ